MLHGADVPIRLVLALTFFVSMAAAQTVSTTGYSGQMRVGSARVESFTGSRLSVLNFFSLQQQNVLTAETAFIGTPSLQTGRIPIEAQGRINTGIAFANANDAIVSVSFSVSDATGSLRGNGGFTLPPHGQLARFVTEAPMNVETAFTGALTFTSTLPIGLTAVRTVVNERFEFLMTALPVIDLSLPAPVASVAVFPYFANGGAWSAEFILVNPADERMSGDINLLDTAGGAIETLAFAIEPSGVYRARPLVTPATTQVGWAGIVPNLNSRTPSGAVVLSYRPASVRIAEITIPVVPGASAFRLFGEADQNFKISSGVAIANPNANAVTANLELTSAAGASLAQASLVIPAFGQVSAILDSLPELAGLPATFQGILRVSTDGPLGVSVLALRRHVNERGESLFSSYPATIEGVAQPVLVPHFVTGAGLSTQFVLFSALPSQPVYGTIQFFDISGSPLSVDLFSVDVTMKPAIQIVSPDVVFPGTTMSLTVSGSNFVPGRLRESVSGGGVSVQSLDSVTENSITAGFVTDPNASLGNRSVSVTSAGGVSNAVTLRVVNVETAATPPQASAGQTNIALTVVALFESIHRYWLGGIRGVQFYANGVNDPAIVLSNVQIQGNVISANMDVGRDAVPAPHTIVLITPSGNIPTIGSLLITPGP